MTQVKAQLGQLMEVLQYVARGQEENLQANERVVAVVPIVNPIMGNWVSVVAQAPP